MIYDRDWYRKRVADPDTGEPRRFIGGGLASVDFELDSLYYGVEHERERLKCEAEVRAACRLLQLMGGQDVEIAPGPPSTVAVPEDPRRPRGPQAWVGLDMTAWLQAFDILWEPENIPSHLDPSTAVNFRLDVLRAMAKLPRTYKRVLVHLMDGYSLTEVADLMGWMREESVTPDFFGRVMFPITCRVPNTESAERVARKANAEVRGLCAMDVPGKKKRGPRPGALDTSVIKDVEAEIQEIRAWRRRELRRRELARHPRAKEVA